MRAWLLGVALLTAGLAGCLGTEEAEPTSAEPVEDEAPERPGERPGVVVAVIDTGINLYHEAYAAPDRWPQPDDEATSPRPADPAGMLQRAGVTPRAVDLSRKAGDWSAAVSEDYERLLDVEAERLYTFPGTKILGAITFYEDRHSTELCSADPCSEHDEWPHILDMPGGYTHGTMASSRAVGNSIAIGGQDAGIWLVMVQGFEVESVEWAAQQDWIDIVSISSGLSAGGLAPGAANVMAQDAIEAFHEASHAKPLFASSGNGAGNVGMAGFPSWLRGASGVPDAVSVGATDNGNLAHWDNQDSYVAADGCANPAARADSRDEVANHGGGTSSATPFSAGGAAKMLLEARRILDDTSLGPRVDENRSVPEGAWDSGYAGDAQVVLAEGSPGPVDAGPLADGVFTMREFKDVLYHTALLTPREDASDGEECPSEGGLPFGGTYVPASAVPEDARFPFQGYGEVNAESIETAIEVLEGEAELPERGTDDWHYQRAHSHKQTFVAGEPEAPPLPSQAAGPGG